MGCDHFFTVLSLHGNHPSMPTYLCQLPGGDFLRLAAHEGVRGGPVHSELPLCFGSLSAATSLTLFAQRGTVCSEFVFQGYQQTCKKSIRRKKKRRRESRVSPRASPGESALSSKGYAWGPSKARIQSPGNNPLYFTCYNGCVTSERIVSLL